MQNRNSNPSPRDITLNGIKCVKALRTVNVSTNKGERDIKNAPQILYNTVLLSSKISYSRTKLERFLPLESFSAMIYQYTV